jgi:hypothetical protein
MDTYDKDKEPSQKPLEFEPGESLVLSVRKEFPEAYERYKELLSDSLNHKPMSVAKLKRYLMWKRILYFFGLG